MRWEGSTFPKGRKWWVKYKRPASSRFTASPTPFRLTDPAGRDLALRLLRRHKKAWLAVPVIPEPPPEPRRYVDPGGPARKVFKRQLGADLACECCGWKPRPPLGARAVNAHHIVPSSAGGSNEPSNLAALCPNCHALAHAIYGRGAAPGRAELLAAIRASVGTP